MAVATLEIETNLPIPFTCADGTGIEKGTLLVLSDPMTVAAHASDEQVFGGVAGAEKIADSGTVEIGVYRDGIFKMTAYGSITVGDSLALSAVANSVKTADASCVAGKTLGVALETATSGETLMVEVRPGFNNKAYS